MRRGRLVSRGQPIEALSDGPPERDALEVTLRQEPILFLGDMEPAALAMLAFDPKCHRP